MNRSFPAAMAIIVLALLAAPRSSRAQVLDLPEGGQHAVVVGNTLWDLAAAFYGDPFLWPRIYEANVDRIEDPHWIYPGQIILIPDEDGTLRQVRVISGDEEYIPVPREDLGPAVTYQEPERTKFYRDTTEAARMAEEAMAQWLAVPQSIFYSAPFLDYTNGEQALGRIVDFEGEEEVRTPRDWMILYDRVVLELDGDMLAPGTRLQVFDLAEPREELEPLVATPTGVVTILHRTEGGVVASVDAQYDRMRTGDLVRPLPDYVPRPGVVPEPVEDGPVSSVVAYHRVHELHQPGNFLFLDMGRGDGLGIGDELVVEMGQPEARVEGRVQVVGLQDEVATARIMMIRNPVFVGSVELRLSRRMPRQ